MVFFGKIVDIKGVKKWYHAALACQTLEVVAIPAKLEKLVHIPANSDFLNLMKELFNARVIQEMSLGNPGWIESYLISLLQSKGIEKKYLSRVEIHRMGLVTPPKATIKRYNSKFCKT